MSGIGAISTSTAIRVIQPVRQSDTPGGFKRDAASASRTAYATAGKHQDGHRKPFTGSFAPFIAQAGANDNGASTSSRQGAIAYIVARDRMTDLPVGFLISKAA